VSSWAYTSSTKRNVLVSRLNIYVYYSEAETIFIYQAYNKFVLVLIGETVGGFKEVRTASSVVFR